MLKICCFCVVFGSLQALGQVKATSDGRFSSLVSQVLVTPDYLPAAENSALTMLKSDDDFDELRLAIRGAGGGAHAIREFLSWTYLEQRKFAIAFPLEAALDKELDGKGKRLYELGNYCFSSSNFAEAERCYRFVISLKNSPFVQPSRLRLLAVKSAALKKTPSLSDANRVLSDYRKYLKDYPQSLDKASLLLEMAVIESSYKSNQNEAQRLLEEALATPRISDQQKSACKLELGDIALLKGNVWDAALYYGQVAKDYGEESSGQDARFRAAKIYYYTGEFALAKSQLDVLKSATSELIANDALKLGLVINENTATDSSAPALKMLARSDLLLAQNKTEAALKTMDSIRKVFPGSALEPDVLIGEARVLLRIKKPVEASTRLEEVVKRFPEAIRADDAILMLADIRQQAGQKKAAIELLSLLLTDYKGSLNLPAARRKIRVLRGETVTESF